MKAIFLVVGTVSLLTSSADADTARHPAGGSQPASVAARKAVRPPAVPAIAKTAPAAQPADEAAPAAEVPPLPDLPADPCTPLAPLAGLEKPHPVAAARPAKRTRHKPVVMNFGKDYVLGARTAANVTYQDVLDIKPRSLSQAQIATVVQSHLDELQACWAAIPRDHRAGEVTAELSLSIAESGTVRSLDVDADVPDAARTCITAAASHWQFPVAETRTDAEYAVSLRSL